MIWPARGPPTPAHIRFTYVALPSRNWVFFRAGIGGLIRACLMVIEMRAPNEQKTFPLLFIVNISDGRVYIIKRIARLVD